MNKQKIVDKLSDIRGDIYNYLVEIETNIQSHFPEEYAVAYQHWIPQILTALYDDTHWLPRGQYSMEYTLKRIQDKLNDDGKRGVSKII